MSDQVPHTLLAAVAAAVIGSTLVLVPESAHLFNPYFGTLNPVLATVAVSALGWILLALLHSRGWFRVHPAKGSPTGLWPAAGLASLLAAIVIIADWGGAFPEGINAALPEALFFYPLMAYVVEVVFHVLPLALLLRLFSRRPDWELSDRAVWGSIFGVALIEPVFQVLWTAPDPPWVRGFLGPHLVLFNLAGLWLFKRNGFLTMLFFRLVYYLHWHVLWGFARLQLLF